MRALPLFILLHTLLISSPSSSSSPSPSSSSPAHAKTKYSTSSFDDGVLLLSPSNFDDVVDGSSYILADVHNNDSIGQDIHTVANAFKHEDDVIIASMSLDDVSFSLLKGRKGFFNIKKGPPVMLLFKKHTSDGECLLPDHLDPLKLPVVYEEGLGGKTVDDIVNFVNKHCNTFRQVNGELSDEGKRKNFILQNLYHSSDGKTCERIPAPSEQDFLENYVAKSKPVIITGALNSWKAMTKWSNYYLRQLLGGNSVNVKLTPDGEFEGCEDISLWNGHDSPNSVPDYVFSKLESPDKAVVRPANLNVKFNRFMDMLYDDRLNASFYLEYCSIKSDLPELLEDIEPPPFARFLEEAITNIWLGNGRTIGKLHFDPFDNLLCQITGKKNLILFDPHNNENLYESHIREAMLHYSVDTNTFSRNTLTDSTSMVMSPVDITKPDLVRYPLFNQTRYMNCTIESGDILYLPSFWWHEVKSAPDTLHRNIAVNYWYTPYLDKQFPCPSCRLFVNPFYDKLKWKDLPFSNSN